jgi:hypothetical protein
MPCPSGPECHLVNGVCRTCTYATPEAIERSREAPHIDVPQPKKPELRGAAHKVDPGEFNDDGTRTVWRKKKEKPPPTTMWRKGDESIQESPKRNKKRK